MTVYINEKEFKPLGDGIYQDVKTGKKYKANLWMIDNGFSMPEKADADDKDSVILSRFSFSIWKSKIPQDMLDSIKKLTYSSFQQKLSKLIDSESMILFNNRIEELLEGKEARISDYTIIKKRKK